MISYINRALPSIEGIKNSFYSWRSPVSNQGSRLYSCTVTLFDQALRYTDRHPFVSSAVLVASIYMLALRYCPFFSKLNMSNNVTKSLLSFLSLSDLHNLSLIPCFRRESNLPDRKASPTSVPDGNSVIFEKPVVNPQKQKLNILKNQQFEKKYNYLIYTQNKNAIHFSKKFNESNFLMFIDIKPGIKEITIKWPIHFHNTSKRPVFIFIQLQKTGFKNNEIARILYLVSRYFPNCTFLIAVPSSAAKLIQRIFSQKNAIQLPDLKNNNRAIRFKSDLKSEIQNECLVNARLKDSEKVDSTYFKKGQNYLKYAQTKIALHFEKIFDEIKENNSILINAQSKIDDKTMKWPIRLNEIPIRPIFIFLRLKNLGLKEAEIQKILYLIQKGLSAKFDHLEPFITLEIDEQKMKGNLKPALDLKVTEGGILNLTFNLFFQITCTHSDMKTKSTLSLGATVKIPNHQINQATCECEIIHPRRATF